eukprot:745511-Amphidinium_carterae.1
MLLEPLRCVELGTLRLEMNMDVDCDSEEHWRWMYGASADSFECLGQKWGLESPDYRLTLRPITRSYWKPRRG